MRWRVRNRRSRYVLRNNHRYRSRRAGALSVGCVGHDNAGVEVMEIITGIIVLPLAAAAALIINVWIMKKMDEMTHQRKSQKPKNCDSKGCDWCTGDCPGNFEEEK